MRARFAAVCGMSFFAAGVIPAAPLVLYGGNGGHPPSINDGSLVTIDQNTGATTLLGTPAGVQRLTGIAFDSTGALWGSTITGGGFPPPPPLLTSTLIQLNPGNGALINSVGPIHAGSATGPVISIADLSVQPGTNVLYGIQSPNDGLGLQGSLYTINKQTAVATLVGPTGKFFGSIAFAPNGTLYMTGAQFAPMTGPVGPTLNTVDPATGKILTSVPMDVFLGAFGIRPSDGVLFGADGDGGEAGVGSLFTVNPSTGATTLVGSTGLNYVGDLDFAAVPEPTTLTLTAAGLLGIVLIRRRRAG